MKETPTLPFVNSFHPNFTTFWNRSRPTILSHIHTKFEIKHIHTHTSKTKTHERASCSALEFHKKRESATDRQTERDREGAFAGFLWFLPTTVSSCFARRTNTFRLAKPTLMPPLEVISASPRGVRRSQLPVVVVPPTRKPTSTLVIMASSPDATARDATSSSSGSGSSSSGGSSPSSVTTVTTIESHSSSTPTSRDLIGEYLKNKAQGPPAIFNPVAPSCGVEDLELAYKHPILLMNEEDEQHVFCSVVSSVGNERNREVEVRYVDDNSIELLDAREDFGEGEKESLIVPKPKKMAFHSLKGSPVKNGVEPSDESKCRLVGKVNPNILKTWEQLSGGDKSCEHKRKNSRNSLITVTSSENGSADSKQSCLIFYRNQYNNMAAPEEFPVNRIQHSSVSTNSTSTTTMDGKTTAPKTSVSMVTSTTTTETTSSEGCYDFYDSIDDSSTRIDGGEGVPEDEDEDGYAMAAGEGLADFTSLDRKKMMWSIDVEE